MPRRRWPRRAALLALAGVAAWLGGTATIADRLTSRARPAFLEPVPEVPWGPLTEARLDTADGERVGFWLADAPPTAPSSAPTVLCLHCNGESRRMCLPLMGMLRAEGFAAAAVTFRAHGDSTGATNDLGYGGRLDVLAAVGEIERRRPGRPVLVQGMSLGAAAVVFAAPELGSRVRGYVLECPYRDLDTAVGNRCDNALPRGLSDFAHLGFRLVGPLVLPHAGRISPVEMATRMPAGARVLVIAGGRDRHARPEEARAVAAAVPGGSRVEVFEEAGHEVYFAHDPARYRALVVPFLRAAATFE